jgi:hypothetical protein
MGHGVERPELRRLVGHRRRIIRAAVTTPALSRASGTLVVVAPLAIVPYLYIFGYHRWPWEQLGTK